MIEYKKLANGFEYIEVQNAVAHAKIALQGAHIFEYKRKGEEALLWLSARSDFEYGKAIRGGVPICWPAFGMNNPDLPQHGFSRTAKFTLMHTKEENNSTELLFALEETQESLEFWPYRFLLIFTVRIGEALQMELTTTNKDTKNFTLTQALHSYFPVSDIKDVKIFGLEDKPYFNALTSQTQLQKDVITFDGEYDCVYQEVDKEIVLQDAARSIKIKSEGSKSVVVWNPWIEKGARMSGMKADAYKNFVCIESANAFEDFKVLLPNESYTLKATLDCVLSTMEW
ncbi:MAG TPA: D-hexose-6-phosphate mutarotase [Sulfurimonas sp. UBA12504]|nr:MAG TPA: D-hexose-6-phosphate mutarotase [Sulfurimonas sp. UBA12504]